LETAIKTIGNILTCVKSAVSKRFRPSDRFKPH